MSNSVIKALLKLEAASAGGLASSEIDSGYLGNGTAIGSGANPFGYGPLLQNVAADVTAVPGGQTLATLLHAQTNIVIASGASYGVILPNIKIGTVTVLNADTVNAVLVYPLIGSSINNLGVNGPYSVPSNYSRVSFTTRDSGVTWYAGVAATTSTATAAEIFSAFASLSDSQQVAFVAAIIASLPTSPTGLSVGQVWNNGGTPTAVVSE